MSNAPKNILCQIGLKRYDINGGIVNFLGQGKLFNSNSNIFEPSCQEGEF